MQHRESTVRPLVTTSHCQHNNLSNCFKIGIILCVVTGQRDPSILKLIVTALTDGKIELETN